MEAMFTPPRLRLARRRRGLTRERLSELTGLTTRSLLAYEAGTQEPTADSLQRMANALSVPADFLTQPEIDEIPIEAVSFRALSKITAGQRDMARAAGRLGVAFYDWITDLHPFPSPDVPQMPGEEPERAATRLRELWNLGSTPISQLIGLLELHGVRVLAVSVDCREVDAYSFVRDRHPYVFLNAAKTAERTRFDAAHELGHLVLHQGDTAIQGPEAERQADRFAGAFLMPAASLAKESLHNANAQQIIAARGNWQVAAMALAYRLHEVGLLTDWLYRSACGELTALGYRTGEPGGIKSETSPHLTHVLSDLRTSLAEAAAGLKMSPSDIRSFLRGIVPATVTNGRSERRPRFTLQI